MLKRILQNHINEDSDITLSRRKFIKNIACGALLTLGSPVLANASRNRVIMHKSLTLYNTHTEDKLKLTYFEKGRYIKPALREINHFLRDFRTGDIYPIDIDLLDLMHDLKLALGINNKPFQIISGYRSPITNNLLHLENPGVSNNSLHMQGKAIDIRVENIATHHIRNAALAMQRGGVGYYPDSDFVHIDTGKVRFW